MKTSKIKSKKTTTVTKGVYATPSGKYFVRPLINGKRRYLTFTNKAEALRAYKYYSNL